MPPDRSRDLLPAPVCVCVSHMEVTELAVFQGDLPIDANGYDGEHMRYSPRSQPTISVGEPIDGEMAFDPR